MSASREAIVTAARSWIGTPYRHQAALRGVGCDCLGLLVGVWREVTGEEAGPLPPYTPDWAEAQGRETFAEGLRARMTEIAPAEAQAGDVLLFRWRVHLPAKHAGILTAPERMVHAQEGAVVTEVPLNGWWKRRVAFGFGFPSRVRTESSQDEPVFPLNSAAIAAWDICDWVATGKSC